MELQSGVSPYMRGGAFRAHRLRSRRNLGGAVRSVDSIVSPAAPLTDD